MKSTRQVKRPVLRYHGGKWRLASWIIGYFPSHRIYVEPFGGAGSVLLRKPRSYAEVWNDLDGEVVNVFRVLRDAEQASRLIEMVRLTPWARDEFDVSYEPVNDPVEQARRTIMRCFMGFGSVGVTAKWKVGFRNNTTRAHTIPAHDWMRYPPALQTVVDRLQGVVIERMDAFKLIEVFDGPDTLFYLDPPYVQSTRGRWARAAYNYELEDKEHETLAEILHRIEGMAVLSGYPSELYDCLYGDWIQVRHKAMADGANERTEVLWLSPRTQEMRMPLFQTRSYLS